MKFRIWSNNENKHLEHPQDVSIAQGDKGTFVIEPNKDGEVIERFTGIKCNWGYDVYENDILTDDYENYLVKWDKEDLRWIMESKSVSQSLTAIRSDDEFRVIGNINENGELLK